MYTLFACHWKVSNREGKEYDDKRFIDEVFFHIVILWR